MCVDTTNCKGLCSECLQERFGAKAMRNPVINPAELAHLWGIPDEAAKELCEGFTDDADAGFY